MKFRWGLCVCPSHVRSVARCLFHGSSWRHQMETFSRYWPFVRGIHRSPVNSPNKGRWRGTLMFSLIWAWMNGWVNNREAGDYYLNQCWNIQWNFNRNSYIFIQEYPFENVGWKMASILSRSQCVKFLPPSTSWLSINFGIIGASPVLVWHITITAHQKAFCGGS